MSPSANLLCPIDFSEPSRGALRYAAAIAAHLGTGLTLLTVNDPLLAQAAAMDLGDDALDAQAKVEADRFFNDTFSGCPPSVSVAITVATGKPPAEILRVARESGARLIVMSSRGATGIRKLFLGSITERVLRETTVPVLVTPPGDFGLVGLDSIKKAIKRILVPVDLTDAGSHQLAVARQISEAIGGPPLILAHVIEPVRAMVPGHAYAANVDNERRDAAEQRLQDLIEDLPPQPRVEPLVVFGDPAEEIAKIAADRDAALIVVGLQATAPAGARMGSVTYRVLSVTHGLVLALPPRP